jgi:hypothetical protein
LFSWLHIDPEELIDRTLDKSQRPGLASSASSMGVEKASPTITMALASSRSASSQSSTALNRRDGRKAAVPPWLKQISDENCPVPCISGQAINDVGRMWSGPWMRSMSSSSEAAGGIPRSALPPAPITLKRSSWRHMTPLGMPVVPPV